MSNWQTKKLGEVMSFKNGINKGSEYFGHGTKIINYKDVYKKPSLLETDIKGLVEVTDSEKQNSNVQAGDVFFTRTSETLEEIGLSSVLLEDVEDGVFSGYVLRGRPFSDDLLPEYCRYLFRVSSFRKEIKRKSSMTTRALTSGKFLSEVIISFPEKPEQERIVGVLEVWDEYIEKLEQKIALKEQLKKGLMQQLLAQSYKNESIVQLGSVVDLLKDGTHGTHKNVDEGPALLSAKDIKGGKVIRRTDSRKISMQDFNQIHKTYNLKEGDILLTIVGTLGRVAQIRNYRNDYTFQRSVAIFRFSEQVNSRFMYYLLSGEAFKKELLKRESKGAQGGVYLGVIGKMKISLPDKHIQKRVVTVLDTISEEVDLLEQLLTSVCIQKKYLLKNLITGKIRTPENLKPKGAN